ncbi:MAG: P63C domain-containing protein [Terriglobia bacterium]
MKEKSFQSKGGDARAARLDPEERSAIASRAALVRWGTENTLLPKETHVGTIKIGQELIQCSVLDNGMRVFSTRAIARTMGSKGKGGRVKKEAESGAQMLPTFLSSDSFKHFIPNDLMVPLVSPVQYRPKHGGRTAFGYEAAILPKICGVILDADKAGAIKSDKMAQTANVLIRAFAQVGVVALIDEATGYQEERAKDELARILEAYVQAEYRPWTRMFPEEFFKQIYRVHKWEYKPGTAKRTPLVGHLINKYVYGQLPPGVLEELRKVNPITEGGYRKRKHFQHLTADTGNEHLDRQITSVITLMRISDTKEELERNIARAFGKPVPPIQERLPLVIEGTAEEIIN